MRCVVALCAVVVGMVGAAGCGQSPSESTHGTNSPSERAAARDPRGPDAVVFDFLEAVRVGNDEFAAQALTLLARQKTAEMDLVVAPPGSETARFSVNEFELVPDGSAHVATVWTDVDELGQPRSDEIVWILRQEPEGWRIAGMATKLLDYQVPLILDFEDPEDMLRRQQLAEQEILRRMQEEALQHEARQGDPGSGQPLR